MTVAVYVGRMGYAHQICILTNMTRYYVGGDFAVFVGLGDSHFHVAFFLKLHNGT